MASIKIADLQPAGSDLFNDSESYLSALSDDELTQTNGGKTYLLILSSPKCLLTGALVSVVSVATYGMYRGFQAARA